MLIHVLSWYILHKLQENACERRRRELNFTKSIFEGTKFLFLLRKVTCPTGQASPKSYLPGSKFACPGQAGRLLFPTLILSSIVFSCQRRPNLSMVSSRQWRSLNGILSSMASSWAPIAGIVISKWSRVLVFRYSLVLGCPMDLQKYPLDTQYCKLEMECYSYQTDSVRLRWRPESPLELPERLFLSSFSLTDSRLENCANVYTSGKGLCSRGGFRDRSWAPNFGRFYA